MELCALLTEQCYSSIPVVVTGNAEEVIIAGEIAGEAAEGVVIASEEAAEITELAVGNSILTEMSTAQQANAEAQLAAQQSLFDYLKIVGGVPKSLVNPVDADLYLSTPQIEIPNTVLEHLLRIDLASTTSLSPLTTLGSATAATAFEGVALVLGILSQGTNLAFNTPNFAEEFSQRYHDITEYRTLDTPLNYNYLAEKSQQWASEMEDTALGTGLSTLAQSGKIITELLTAYQILGFSRETHSLLAAQQAGNEYDNMIVQQLQNIRMMQMTQLNLSVNEAVHNADKDALKEAKSMSIMVTTPKLPQAANNNAQRL